MLDPTPLLDCREAAARLHVSVRTVRRYGQSGLLDRATGRPLADPVHRGVGRRHDCQPEGHRSMILPITSHRGGRAAPLNPPKPNAAPAPTAPGKPPRPGRRDPGRRQRRPGRHDAARR